MPYKVINLQKTDNAWSCDLEHWEGCYCSKTTTPVSIEQDQKPTLKQIVLASQ